MALADSSRVCTIFGYRCCLCSIVDLLDLVELDQQFLVDDLYFGSNPLLALEVLDIYLRLLFLPLLFETRRLRLLLLGY